MFRSTATEPAPVEVEPADLIPLSHFALDHPQPPEGWSNFLGRRGITLRPDDIGRDSIRRSDAQMLLHEQRANELRVAKLRQLAEQEAVEQDRVKFAQIWRGAAATELPDGVSAGDAMIAAARDSQPRRRSLVEEAFSNTGETVFHPYPAVDQS